VWVHRNWNNASGASYRLADLADPHWSSVSGGFRAPSPQPFIYGYVDCEGAIEGEVPHSGRHGPCPHRIKVCVVAKDNPAAVMAALREAAGPKPKG